MLNLSQIANRVGSFIDQIPGVYQPTDDLETTISELAKDTVLAAAGALFVLTLVSILVNNKFPRLKLPTFILIIITLVGSTVTLIGSTVYLNVSADSGGPVHWHADFEVWACGNELELRDPTGFLSNKIGTATLHEHNDRRVHLEGVVVDEVVDASLGKFFYVIGGAVTGSDLVVPLNADGEGDLYEEEVDGDGPSDANSAQLANFIVDDPELGKVARFSDGQSCGDVASDVQVFVYSYNGEDKTYEQRKLDNPRDYVIFDDSNVPPGDCVIFEFGPEREKTDKLCEQYGVRDIERCAEFGVEPDQRAICELTQTNYDRDADYTVQQAAAPATTSPVGQDAPNDNPVVSGPAVHSDANLEATRVACELGGGLAQVDPSPPCQDYQVQLASNPEAQAEADAANASTETEESPDAEVQGVTDTNTGEEGVL